MIERRGSAAYSQLRHMIVEREWSPGVVMTESELARQLDVSRTPVREALLRLAGEGYISPAAGRGYQVIELSDRDVVNVYRVRAVLEGLAAHEAATVINRSTLGELEDLFEAMEQARADGDNRTLAELNSQFHHAITRASGNTYLEATLSNIYDVFERFRPVALIQPGRRDHAAHEHGEIIAALRAKDGDAAREIAERHVHGALSTRQAAERRSEYTDTEADA
jgi:DNA-binding GntR family transcriptional regulator